MINRIHTNIKINKYAQVFLLCFLTASMMIIPFIVKGHGLFTIIDDFNYQQIPFNIQSNDAIKHGNIFWNWYTDLGSNFIGSYSFYTLGSPFFWLTLLFPAKFFPYIIGPMLILKYCVAGLTSYAYIERYLKDKNYAVIGALLYAFSGFSTVNLMFNHFHDVIAFFPLLLLGLDKLVEDKKKGFFAVAVTINALLNFFFFIGEVIFLILYYSTRYLTIDFKKNIKSLPIIMLESTFGLGIACIIFIPSILFTLQNPRTNSFLYGASGLFFDGNRYLAILRSVLMPADLMAYQSSLFQTDYSSSSAFIPLFGISLVIALVIETKNWMSRTIKVITIFAIVPVLNSIFYVFNATYYARWFYMPVLIMSLISAYVLENRANYSTSKGIKITVILTGAFILYLAFYPTDVTRLGFINHQRLFAFYLSLVFSGLILSWIFLAKIKTNRTLICATLISIIIFSTISGFINIYKMKSLRPGLDSVKLYNIFVNTSEKLKFPQNSQSYRINAESINANYSMISNVPSVSSFTSTVNGSIFKFYDSLEMPRVNGNYSSISANSYGLKSFLSVKYDIVEKKENKKLIIKYFNGANTIYVYENKYYLPIGFTYNYYITQKQLSDIPANERHLALLKAVVVSNNTDKSINKLLNPLPNKQLRELNFKNFIEDVRNRKRESSSQFKRNSAGFSSHIMSDTNKIAFFSVPFDSGWKAMVNNKPVKIIKSDGFMSVPISSGENKIVFKYMTPGLQVGAIISITSCICQLKNPPYSHLKFPHLTY